ncbi:uncharacterized protein LOC144645461 isoform X2 [Oculina patagonica]
MFHGKVLLFLAICFLFMMFQPASSQQILAPPPPNDTTVPGRYDGLYGRREVKSPMQVRGGGIGPIKANKIFPNMGRPRTQPVKSGSFESALLGKREISRKLPGIDAFPRGCPNCRPGRYDQLYKGGKRAIGKPVDQPLGENPGTVKREPAPINKRMPSPPNMGTEYHGLGKYKSAAYRKRGISIKARSKRDLRGKEVGSY